MLTPIDEPDKWEVREYDGYITFLCNEEPRGSINKRKGEKWTDILKIINERQARVSQRREHQEG